MSILSSLFRRQRRSTAASRWHRWILSTARTPDPYLGGWVPDTLEGRFQMVTLVTTLVLRRLRVAEGGAGKLSDQVYRAVFSGFDHALREEGVGDSSIARRMRKMGEEFFGLARRLDAAFAQQDAGAGLALALTDNGVCDPAHAHLLGDWLIAQHDRLDGLDQAASLDGPDGGAAALGTRA
jgi:cytochrome b pre-mRNA-processing protein 3